MKALDEVLYILHHCWGAEAVSVCVGGVPVSSVGLSSYVAFLSCPLCCGRTHAPVCAPNVSLPHQEGPLFPSPESKQIDIS